MLFVVYCKNTFYFIIVKQDHIVNWSRGLKRLIMRAHMESIIMIIEQGY